MFIPHTDSDKSKMLQRIGVNDLADLFKDVPEAYRFPHLNLPPAMTEMEIAIELNRIAQANATANDLISFLGAGAYHHYIPSAVDAIIRRGEFASSYTPYQPEISQGTLQAIYDYQSLIAALTGMEVSNASHYDGATSMAEAISLAYANFRGKRTKIIIHPAVNPQYRAVCLTYNYGANVKIIGANLPSSSTPDELIPLIDADTALVIIQYPDFFGRIFDFSALSTAIHAVGGLLAVSVNPIALGLLKPPGEFDVDIVTGEGQPLGIPLSYGGPYLGLFATKLDLVRKMAGRLVGETIDNRGQRAFVLTLTAREQHIRREKATSNICTNQGLMALAATVYLSLLGKHGLRKVAQLCYQKSHYAARSISSLPGFSLWSNDPFFHEFVVKCPIPAKIINERLLEYEIIGGYELSQDYPAFDHHLLVAVTEMNTKDEIDLLVNALLEVSHD
jgi:glycine dehydrogenase subunit 1